MVVISAPSTALSGVMQERAGLPPTWTVQAPHMPMPHPNLVPVSPAFSRITHSSGVSASASTVICFPLILKLAMPDTLRRWRRSARAQERLRAVRPGDDYVHVRSLPRRVHGLLDTRRQQ